MDKRIMRDVLYNLSTNVTSDHNHKAYGRGVLVGVVSSLMASQGLLFKEAVEIVKPLMPDSVDTRCIPGYWREDFEIVDMEAENE